MIGTLEGIAGSRGQRDRRRPGSGSPGGHIRFQEEERGHLASRQGETDG